LNRRKRRILRRIENKPGVERHQPMMAASNMETGTNRGLRDSLFGRSGIGLHARIPALERGPGIVSLGIPLS
jgi:hypothetical protein